MSVLTGAACGGSGVNSVAAGGGFTRQVLARSPEQVAAGWTCRKRDGAVVPFDVAKVRGALVRCFRAAGRPDGGETDRLVDRLAGQVVYAVAARPDGGPVDVEHVQRLVIQQLWAAGLFDEAELYQNYRERRRQARLARPVSAEARERVRADRRHFRTDLQYYQFLSKFARWRDGDRRRETWQEAVYERVIPWLRSVPGVVLSEAEWRELADAMYALEASPAMRVVQMAGPALDRCNVGVYNCAYMPLSDLFAFPELLYVLMQGTGVGFSCESAYVSELPRVRRQRDGVRPDVIVVEDTTEGWCSAYFELLQRLWDGHDAELDVSRVRPRGARLRTKGGRASGPEPLLELCGFARALLKSRQGRFLEDVDAHDLACMTGRIVQVGGVRRAAEISLSDLGSAAMRDAKSGNWYETAIHRTMANNSAVYDFDGPPPPDVFLAEWLALVRSRSGERGIFNRRAALRHSPPRRQWGGHAPGCNPCAEILLRPYEFCNLSIAVARPDDTYQSLARKVRLATVFGKIQSLCTRFNYVRPEWKANCEEERLLGVDVTGHADCPLLRYGAPGRAELLRRLRQVVEDTDLELSRRWGVGRSAANTTVKPGGDSSVFFDCASGVSPWFSPYQVRWVREAADSPVARFLAASGVPHAPAPEAPERLLVFGFPRAAPPGATVRDDMTAEDQFYNWLEWKQNWAEHSVSATIYVADHEWPRLGALVYEHIDHITGLSFLPRDNGVYTYAPNEAVSPEQYAAFVARFPDIDWARLAEYENDDLTEAARSFSCVGGGCD